MKIVDVLSEVHLTLKANQYRYVGHAIQRLQQREVTYLEVKQVLRRGCHEKQKDKFKTEHGNWNYSIRGKTVDNRNLRVIVTFNEDDMLIITVIDLEE